MKWLVQGLVVLAVAAAVYAGASAGPFVVSDAIVAVVKKVPAAAGTYGQPPQVVVEVQEVWRGEARKGELSVVWGPPPHDFDTQGGREAERKAWEATKLEAPHVGSKWIVLGDLDEGVLRSRSDMRWVWNKANDVEVRKGLAAVDEARHPRVCELRRPVVPENPEHPAETSRDKR